MNICLFFEGTGQGVAGKITNVTRRRDLCVDDARQKLHLEPGPGTHFGSYLAGKIAGVDWRTTFRDARRWFESNYETLPEDGISTKVFLFGFSRGALIARHIAAWLDKLGVAVVYLGLWYTVDATVGLDVVVDCPRNVRRARHAVSRDETRKFFECVPFKGDKRQVVEMLFPDSHSDVGGLYDDNHLMATLLSRGLRQARSAKGCASSVVSGSRKSSTPLLSFCTTPTASPQIFGAHSTVFAADCREFVSISPAGAYKAE